MQQQLAGRLQPAHQLDDEVGAGHQTHGVGREQLLRQAGLRTWLVDVAHRGTDDLQRRPDPRLELVGPLLQPSGDCRAHHTAAQQGHPHGFAHITPLPAPQVVHRLAPQPYRDLAVAQGENGWARNVVVLARERPAVGTRRRHRQQVPRAYVVRELHVADHDVAALAVFADDPGLRRVSAARPIRQYAGVFGAVEHGPGVVTHPAVHRDVGADQVVADPHRLDGSDLVERDARRTHDRPPGLHRDPRQRHSGLRAGVPHDGSELPGHLSYAERFIRRQVGDPESSPRSSSGSWAPVLRGDRQLQCDQPSGGLAEAVGLEDLAADVGVESQQLQRVRRGEYAAYRFAHLTVEAESELLVLMGGGDELVGVRLDPGLGAQHHPRDERPLARSGSDAIDLLEGVDDDAPDPRVERLRDLRGRFVVAVQRDLLPRNARALRHGELAAGADVEAQALLLQQAGHGRAQEGLARVVDVRPGADGFEGVGEGLAERGGPAPDVGLVEHVRRRTPPAGDVSQVVTADTYGAVVGQRGAGREDPLQHRPAGVTRAVVRHGGVKVPTWRHGSRQRPLGETRSRCSTRCPAAAPASPWPLARIAGRSAPAGTVTRRCRSAARPRSSGDRASPSGGESAGSNPAGGTHREHETAGRPAVSFVCGSLVGALRRWAGLQPCPST